MKTGFQLVDDRHFLGCGDRIALVPWLRPGTQCPGGSASRVLVQQAGACGALRSRAGALARVASIVPSPPGKGEKVAAGRLRGGWRCPIQQVLENAGESERALYL